MRRSSRLTVKRSPLPPNSSDEDEPKPKIKKTPPRQKRNEKNEQKQNSVPSTSAKKTSHPKESDGSSSESDIENYLQPADKIDLNSSFFQVTKPAEQKTFESIERDIFAGINRLSDSESEDELEQNQNNPIPPEQTETKQEVKEPKPTKLNFQQLHDYTRKLEEAKKTVEKYEASKKMKQAKHKKVKEEKLDVSQLLALGEAKVDPAQLQTSMHSSDFESFSDSEKEDWEEVEQQEAKETKSLVPKDGVQITVELPGVMRKKKGVDLIASMKRRLNRIKKENQVFIHKVHLLCWLAHGNHVNKTLNNEDLLALGLSLLPSQHCYPSERTDLGYLEQIVKWYKNAIPNVEKSISKDLSLENALKLQINRKEAFNKKMLVYIFICILRSLGIQCRLVLSFQVIPLRPPVSELQSLSTKNNDKNQKNVKNDGKQKTKEHVTAELVDSPKKKDESRAQKKDMKSKEGKDPPKKPNLKAISSTKTSTSETNSKAKSNTSKEKNKTQNAGLEPKAKPRSKSSSEKKSQNKTSKSDSLNVPPTKKSKSTSEIESNSTKKSRAGTKKIKNNNVEGAIVCLPQVDGAADSDNDEMKSQKAKKPNLNKLTQPEANSCPNKKHLKRLKSLPNYTEPDSEEDFNTETVKKPCSSLKPSTSTNLKKLKSKPSTATVKSEQKSKSKPSPKNSQYFKQASPKPGDIRGDIISIMKGRIAQERAAARGKMVKNRRSQSDEDSDYAPEPIKKKRHDSDDEFYTQTKVKVKQRIKVKKTGEEEEPKSKKGVDVWVEVYLEAEEKWISADVVKGQVHCISELYTRASHPVTYVVAWNNDNSLKDITQRYCQNWNTVTRKLRIDKKWWESTLQTFAGRKTARDREEDEELARLQLEKPLPTSIAEYKNHPLYVLKRHLLKFEALYPPEPITLGFVKNEAVYPRECVHILHSREVWIKYAKVVKPGEQPYKIVKARPKYDKLSGQVISDQPLELFGKWQVDDYVPPTAENGIVPRNAFGNVELFKSCMLPKGTVHLQLPGLNKLARKMNIDCALAVVGFDYHSGGSHPTFDGFVVCEEYAEVLIAAWHIEQEEQEKREQEKIEKRVYGNWKKLIKGLLIRERLKARYNFGEPSQAASGSKKRKPKGPKFVAKKRRLCSGSESENESS